MFSNLLGSYLWGLGNLLFEILKDFDQLFVYNFVKKICLHFSDHHHHHHHHKISHGDKYKDKHGNGSSSSNNSKDKKDSKSKYERQSSKVEEIEAKIKEKSIKSFKSDKLNSFDMFAPKTPKPKLVMPKPVESQKPTPSNTPISNNSPSVSRSLPKSPVSVIVILYTDILTRKIVLRVFFHEWKWSEWKNP